MVEKTTEEPKVEKQTKPLSDGNAGNITDEERLPRILVLDDDRDIADAVKMAIGNKYWVDVYLNPEQALRAYKVGYYDLILLDYAMPFMDGFVFYANVKRMDPDVKVCLMTAYELFPSKVAKLSKRQSHDQILPTLDVGPLVLKKPFDRSKLLSTIASILE